MDFFFSTPGLFNPNKVNLLIPYALESGSLQVDLFFSLKDLSPFTPGLSKTCAIRSLRTPPQLGFDPRPKNAPPRLDPLGRVIHCRRWSSWECGVDSWASGTFDNDHCVSYLGRRRGSGRPGGGTRGTVVGRVWNPHPTSLLCPEAPLPSSAPPPHCLLLPRRPLNAPSTPLAPPVDTRDPKVGTRGVCSDNYTRERRARPLLL